MGDLCPLPDKRGKHPLKHKLNDVVKLLVYDHVYSFNPSVSHYRRKHAPHRHCEHTRYNAIKEILDLINVLIHDVVGYHARSVIIKK